MVEHLRLAGPRRMRAMEFAGVGKPMLLAYRSVRAPSDNNLLIQVTACGVCRTDLHLLEGDLRSPKRRVIPGHEVIGRVTAMGPDVRGFHLGDRVGVPWLGFTCGRCRFCMSCRENLCDRAKFTGYTLDGGFAEFITANASYSFHVPAIFSDAEAAPLMCAGLIGYRCWKLTQSARTLGIYGFGAAAHIVAQLATELGQDVYAFTRPGDKAAQKLARSLGAAWAGASDTKSPVALEAAIIFAPIGPLVPTALRNLAKGGTLVLGGIHMTDIPSLPYELLWGERTIRSVANLTRQDGVDFLEIAARIPIRPRVTTFGLTEANTAVERLRDGRLVGAAVLTVSK